MAYTADLIDDRIWLGNIDAARDKQALDILHITHILSLHDLEEPNDENDKIIRKHISVEDEITTDLLIEFNLSYDFINNALSTDPNNNVLIHCIAGVSRSATIACMWLMRRYKLSVNDALNRLVSARRVVRPNLGFLAQLYLFEQMNYQLDPDHELYKEFQFERARNIYIDHDTEYKGIEEKNKLRQQFCHAFTLPYGHATCKIFEKYICRQCQTELFTNVDLSRHKKGLGQFDWYMKYAIDKSRKSSDEIACQEKLFTNYLKWIMSQIDTPENCHSNTIKCPQCSTIIGNYNLNGAKCSCGRWVTPSFLFDNDKIEKQTIKEFDVETKLSS